MLASFLLLEACPNLGKFRCLLSLQLVGDMVAAVLAMAVSPVHSGLVMDPLVLE